MSRTPSLLRTDRVGESVRLADDVDLVHEDGVVRALRRERSLRLRDDAVPASLRDGVDVDLLTRSFEEDGDIPAVLRVRAAVAVLDAAGFLDRSVHDGDGLAAVLHPLAVGPTALAPVPGSWTAAPFVSAEVRGGMLVLQAADGGVEVRLPPRQAARWLELSAGVLPAPEDTAVMRALATAGILTTAPPSAAAVWWSAREWALHRQTRNPAVSRGFAGTMRHAGMRSRVPAWAPPAGARRVPLRRPDLAIRRAGEPAFVDVVEGRRSRRVHDDDRPVTVDALAELLYRTTRVTLAGDVAGTEVRRRPVAAGGSLHELEMFVVVDRCDGLEAAAWWYDDRAHELVHVASPCAESDRLLEAAGSAAGTGAAPQILLIMAARFGRLMDKYEAIGYSLVLKHVGVMMHALQLTAEAMQLATCPIGAGRASDFERLTGVDPFELGPVGDLSLGSRGRDHAGGRS